MNKLNYRLKTAGLRVERDWRIWTMNRQVKAHARTDLDIPPIVLFNASSRLGGFSQNSAFTLLTGWGLQLAGVPVVHFVCHGGMTRCVLGTNPDDPMLEPPCTNCIRQSKKLTSSAKARWFSFHSDRDLKLTLANLSLEELSLFEYPIKSKSHDELITIPFGRLVLPSLRWALRRHHLRDDKNTRFLYREFIQSAYVVAEKFDDLLSEIKPQVIVIFNGLQFPEATVSWVSQHYGVRVITHEVGFLPFSVFFSNGQVTAYPLDIPEGFELNTKQQSRIDKHLSRRFQGDFTMAGIKFWPEMVGLSDDFLNRSKSFKQIVPIFTNVIFDTSQVHANTIFSNMFAWLELLLRLIKNHPETLFVVRAHPDEMRVGKKSRESVQDWAIKVKLDELPNVIFVPSDGALSSYDLIRRSKFVIVYNSSIGLEAALLGVPVLCGGKARYTQYPTVFLPGSEIEFEDLMEKFLSEENIKIPPEFQQNARRVLYHQFYRSSLPMANYLKAHPTPGYVQLKSFSWRNLLMESSQSMHVIIEGIMEDEPFLMPDDDGLPEDVKDYGSH